MTTLEKTAQQESKHKERNKEIYNLRIGGLIYKEIASIYGLSVGQVRQIFLKEERLRSHPLYSKEYA
jgi:DNA-binding CsgD family transcriptional regulator